jgi:hypothetical protein
MARVLPDPFQEQYDDGGHRAVGLVVEHVVPAGRDADQFSRGGRSAPGAGLPQRAEWVVTALRPSGSFQAITGTSWSARVIGTP